MVLAVDFRHRPVTVASGVSVLHPRIRQFRRYRASVAVAVSEVHSLRVHDLSLSSLSAFCCVCLLLCLQYSELYIHCQ